MVDSNSFTEHRAGVTAAGGAVARALAAFGLDGLAQAAVRSTLGFADHRFFAIPGSRGGPVVMVVAHADTVYPPEVEARHGHKWRAEPATARVHGPGTNDMHGGTVSAIAMMSVVRELQPEAFRRASWLFCLNSAEEVLCADFAQAALGQAEALCARTAPLGPTGERALDRVRAALVFEMGPMVPAAGDDGAGEDHDRVDDWRAWGLAGSALRLVTSRKGMMTWRIHVRGTEAHAGNQHDRGASAIDAAAHLVGVLHARTAYARGVTFNVGRIDGGTTHNTVAGACSMHVEMRCVDAGDFERERAFVESGGLQAAFEQHARASPQSGARALSVECQTSAEPWARGHAGTAALLEHWREVAGRHGARVDEEARGGLSDANRLWRHVPTLDGLGPSGGNAHCARHDPAAGQTSEHLHWRSVLPKLALNAAAVAELVVQPHRERQ